MDVQKARAAYKSNPIQRFLTPWLPTLTRLLTGLIPH